MATRTHRNEVVDILMERDGMTEDEARERVLEVRGLIYDAMEDLENCEDIEDIIADELGLEPDYLFEII